MKTAADQSFRRSLVLRPQKSRPHGRGSESILSHARSQARALNYAVAGMAREFLAFTETGGAPASGRLFERSPVAVPVALADAAGNAADELVSGVAPASNPLFVRSPLFGIVPRMNCYAAVLL